MKAFHLLISLSLAAFLFTQCSKDSEMEDVSEAVLKSAKSSGTYTITVENVSTNFDYFASGVQAIPLGKDSPGPAHQGESYTFSFHAGPKHKLSFATMFGWSNDGFFAPVEGGISLYSGGTPTTGNITSMVYLWDAGTEENQPPGQNNPHDGANVTDGMVQLMSSADVTNNYGAVETNLEILLDYNGNSMFTLTINNLGGSLTPISPVVWVVHFEGQNPIFTEGQMDSGHGLENVAESGDAGPLSSYLDMNSGYVSPIAPVLWVLHEKQDFPIFMDGTSDYGIGLEALAETGNPGPLYASLIGAGYEAGVHATPEGSIENGPIFPGQKYIFTIEGQVGQTVSLAMMLGESNDVFFSPGDKGFKLSNGVSEKDITNLFELYDAGTEVNEYPGAKAPDDMEEYGVVQSLAGVEDGFAWPVASQVIKVIIKKN